MLLPMLLALAAVALAATSATILSGPRGAYVVEPIEYARPTPPPPPWPYSPEQDAQMLTLVIESIQHQSEGDAR